MTGGGLKQEEAQQKAGEGRPQCSPLALAQPLLSRPWPVHPAGRWGQRHCSGTWPGSQVQMAGGHSQLQKTKRGLFKHICSVPPTPPREISCWLGSPPAPPLGPELGRTMPDAWQVQAASAKPPVGSPQQNGESSIICLRGRHLPHASLVPSPPSRGLSTMLL